MNITYHSIILGLIMSLAQPKSQRPKKIFEVNASIYNINVTDIKGNTISMNEFKGKKLLIVNTASRCGFTPQYEGLKKLHEKYKGKITILGFPSNNFGKQEPGNNQEILKFCQTVYSIDFLMFEKINVIGKEQHPLYKWLSDEKLNGWNNKAPTWNFCKYLIDEEGKLQKFFASSIKPMSKEIINFIENE